MTKSKRTDEQGRAFAGSQLQTQLAVNSHARRTKLDQALLAALHEKLPDGARLEWVSPLASDRYAERMGVGMLHALGLDEHVEAFGAFWPSRGPSWDALARILDGSGQPWGVLLAEAKSHVNEMLAGSPLSPEAHPENAKLIRESLQATRLGLGLEGSLPDAWTARLYQNVNRLAHAKWLRERGTRAFLAHLLFIDDPHKPTSEAQWAEGLADAEKDLGLDVVEIPWAVHVHLPAGTHEELVAATS